MHYKAVGLNLIRFPLCGLLLVQMGCSTMSSGIADMNTAINANKQIEENVNVSALAAYKAAVAALTELNMSITGQYQDGTSVGMKSKFADSDTVWIEITSISTVSCMVAVRVGVFANEHARARAILAAIVKNLPNESTESEMQPVQDKLKQTDNVTTDTLQQPLQNENDGSSADTPSEELKPLPQEIVTEKSLL
jgi:hypothetical protein